MGTVGHQKSLDTIRPFWNRVTAMESPVDEGQRDSGLIVPIGTDVERAVVLFVGASTPPLPDPSEWIEIGSVIYYRKGRALKLREIVIVEFVEIVAYES